MNVQEFSDRFNIQYNSVVGANNPGLTEYEKSVYLTRAQLEVVKSLYDGTSNIKGQGFESNERRREQLKRLIADYKTSTFKSSDENINRNSVFIPLPEDVMYIVHERVMSLGKCKSEANVLPVTHDEYNIQINNPFRKPNKNRAWRLDYSGYENKDVVEVLYVTKLFEYKLRYIKFPKPIILIDLAVEYPNENVTIDGIAGVSECELNKELHSVILNRAVELAKIDYNSEGLDLKVQMNQRSE